MILLLRRLLRPKNFFVFAILFLTIHRYRGYLRAKHKELLAKDWGSYNLNDLRAILESVEDEIEDQESDVQLNPWREYYFEKQFDLNDTTTPFIPTTTESDKIMDESMQNAAKIQQVFADQEQARKANELYIVEQKLIYQALNLPRPQSNVAAIIPSKPTAIIPTQVLLINPPDPAIALPAVIEVVSAIVPDNIESEQEKQQISVPQQIEKPKPLPPVVHAPRPIGMNTSRPRAMNNPMTKPFIVHDHLKATKLHIFYRSEPQYAEQRHLIREYYKKWLSNIDDIIPADYVFITTLTTETQLENESFGDLIFADNIKSEYSSEAELLINKNLPTLDGDLMIYSIKASVKFTSPTEVNLYTPSTDIIDLQTMRNTTWSLTDIAQGESNLICFTRVTRDPTKINSCGDSPKLIIRSDDTARWWEKIQLQMSVKPFTKTDYPLISGSIRMNAGIRGIGVSMDPHNVMQLPWLLPDYQIFHDQVFKWGMDRLPPNMMSYALPERYTLSSENIWKVDLVVVPPCVSDSMYLNIVKSGRNNEKRRAMIRLYSQMVKDYILQQPDPNPLPQVRFVLGRPKIGEDPQIKQTILKEMAQHNDIIIGDFIDDYDSLPLKTLAGYTYVKKHCGDLLTNPQWIMFHDDDVLLDPQKLMTYLSSPTASNFNCFGFLGDRSRPDRWGKYNVTIEQWSSGHYFPHFCSGPCNGIRKDQTWKIFDAASITDTKGFKLEDVLFTGIIRVKAGIPTPYFQKDICKHFVGHTPGYQVEEAMRRDIVARMKTKGISQNVITKLVGDAHGEFVHGEYVRRLLEKQREANPLN